jgi:glycosyltransferase involved in cell wall biosynthesis
VTSPLDLSVVMPAFNEAQILATSATDVLSGLRSRGGTFELIVVENGSTDATPEIAARLSAENAELRVEQLGRADYGRALRAGLLSASGMNVVNFDADFYDLEFLDAALRLLDGSGAPSIVVGSKRAPGTTDTRSPLRRFVTATFSSALRMLFGVQVSDTHGMKAMRREPVAPIAQACRFGTDLFDTELVIRAERAGLGTAEIPVTVVERRPPRTSILRRAPRAALGLLRLRVALWRDTP